MWRESLTESVSETRKQKCDPDQVITETDTYRELLQLQLYTFE